MRRSTMLLALLLLVATEAAAASAWVHVRVDAAAAGDESVSIDVPVSMARALLANVETDAWDTGRLSLGRGASWSDVELREVLTALRDAPDGEFLKIRSRDESVRVAKDAGFFLVYVDGEDGERVRVRMPLEVLDALVANGEERLDLSRALDALAERGGGDLVTVDSDDGRVRIWIDERPHGD